jgi:hypothetical protein
MNLYPDYSEAVKHPRKRPYNGLAALLLSLICNPMATSWLSLQTVGEIWANRSLVC